MHFRDLKLSNLDSPLEVNHYVLAEIKIQQALLKQIATNFNNEEMTTISIIIISMTKFWIMIGSPHAYLSCNEFTIVWVSSYTGFDFL